MGFAEELAASRNFLMAEDVYLLKIIAADLPDNALVFDLGVGSGTTALAILETHQTARVFSLDVSKDALMWSAKAIVNAGLEDRWFGSLGPAAVPLRHLSLPADPADAVLLDASHLYEETAAELAVWAPRVRVGGWLWCHDYVGDGGLGEGENGVRRAVDEYVARFPHRFGPSLQMGLGIAFKVVGGA